MISKKHRFHGHNSLNYVYRHGKSVRGPMFAVKYVKNLKRTNYRAAVVVSKKVNKRAVVRNRIRRRIYEVVRQIIPPSRPYDIVITVFANAVADAPPEEIVAQITEQLNQAGVLHA